MRLFPGNQTSRADYPRTVLRHRAGVATLIALFVTTIALIGGLSFARAGASSEPAAVFVQRTQGLFFALAAALMMTFALSAWLLLRQRRDNARLSDQQRAYLEREREAFENAGDPILIFNAAGRLEAANVAAERLFGRGRAALQGHDLSLIVDAGSRQLPLTERLGVTHEGLAKGVLREMWARDSEDRRFPIDVVFRDLIQTGGTRIAAFVRDVSERRAAQEALEKSERKFRLLVNGVTDHCLYMVDPQGIIIDWNVGAERLYGYTSGEVLGRSFGCLYPEAERTAGLAEQNLCRVLEQGRIEIEGLRVRKDGSQFWASVVVEAIRDASGKVVSIANVQRDFTERRRIEQLKDEFVSTVNHELRTPLTSIAGSLGLLAGGAGGALPAPAARLITIAHANCQRLIRLINDMLDVEKIQSGKMRFEIVPLRLGEVLQRAIDAMGGYATESGIGLELAVEDAVIGVRADQDRLIQVATNLISNAIKFSRPGGLVRVSVARAGRLARFGVHDCGPGIPDEFRSRIFSKFAQADSSDSRQKGGTGLGLVIAKEIVDRHGGRLWFESEPGKKTSFFVDLPLVDDVRSPLRQYADATLLVCEDDPDVASVLCDILERDGFVVDLVTTLTDAQRALTRPSRYRVLLLDLLLPDGNGVNLIRDIRGKPDSRDLPIIVISAHAEGGREALGANALNLVDWMDKPIDTTRLRDAVAVALGRTSKARPLILHVEDDHDVLQVTAQALRDLGEVVSAQSLAAARAVLARRRPDLLILDLGLADGSGLDLLPELNDGADPLVPVLIFSAQDTDQFVLPQVQAVLTKSKTSLAQLARAVKHFLEAPPLERRLAG